MKNIIYLLAICLLTSCAKKLFSDKWVRETAPESFKARFETTKGNFDIYAKRSWSPKGVDRLYTLIKHKYYTDMPIFRVVPNFVAQFGIHNDSIVNKAWNTFTIDDEPVVAKNDAMTIAFARGGKQTRTTQIFINLKENHRLDTLTYSGVRGFPVVAKVIMGFENILQFYDKYGDKLGRRQDSITQYGNDFIKRKYPEIDFIEKAYILKSKK
ncbi:peptidylprolyl isomerase [uncultured Polaribacter sp.]|uniref:peptidylprolyl isomerase n=1 Tax=uncultured Polaribacter sp. TaxID=174711 RepID=UPI00260E1E2C|nr:peptidylprolyl isomerase [uncultured Polaribacter sp.]